jgi:hypothetical protein
MFPPDTGAAASDGSSASAVPPSGSTSILSIAGVTVQHDAPVMPKLKPAEAVAAQVAGADASVPDQPAAQAHPAPAEAIGTFVPDGSAADLTCSIPHLVRCSRHAPCF